MSYPETPMETPVEPFTGPLAGKTRPVLVAAKSRRYRRCSALLTDRHPGGMSVVYKEFAIEAIVWLIPVVVLVGLAYMITRPA
ncbi:hypothetical protein [Streptosporangium sp. NPDC006007]|uniref:hypothetical protein n=1 Tax=Streptosporangium sp. NPDC006007 TaxID=3154575 RepID=UPI0033AD7CD5